MTVSPFSVLLHEYTQHHNSISSRCILLTWNRPTTRTSLALPGLTAVQRFSFLKHKKLTDLYSRPEPSTPISLITDSQHHHQPSTREVPSSEASNSEDERDSHRPITEFVARGTVAPTHFATRRRRLLHPASDPALDPSSVSLVDLLFAIIAENFQE